MFLHHPPPRSDYMEYCGVLQQRDCIKTALFPFSVGSFSYTDSYRNIMRLVL